MNGMFGNDLIASGDARCNLMQPPWGILDKTPKGYIITIRASPDVIMNHYTHP